MIQNPSLSWESWVNLLEKSFDSETSQIICWILHSCWTPWDKQIERTALPLDNFVAWCRLKENSLNLKIRCTDKSEEYEHFAPISYCD
jgi:hypothetical protein